MRYGVLALAVVAALAALPAAGAPAPRRSTLSPGTDEGAARWSPGGRMLLLDTSWESKNYGTFYNLAVAEPGGRSRVIGRHDSGEFEEWDREGVWSPSGSLVAFTRTVGLGDADHIYVSGIGGAGQRRLSRPGTDVHETSPTWSPDGREIAFLSGDAISAVRPDGSDRRVILSGDASEPRWSPDGRLIAFLRKSPRSDARRVFVVRPDGAGLRQVAGDGSYALGGWSPDSSRLLVVAGVRNGDYRMRVLRADGSGVADLGRGAAPDWSPDGARIVFWRTDGLYVVPSVGGAPRRVYRFPAPQGVNEPPSTAPDWSPDGRRIAFAVQRDCISRGAYVLELATGKVQRASNDCHIVGTARRDALRGTNERDIVRGLAGNDVLDGNPGDRPNPHHGRYDRDLLDGGPGSDVLLGRRNADVLLGGPGNDRLLGGRGVDRLLGGAGSDAFFARDGWRDTIRCGPGFDTVVADRVDLVTGDCERVTRAAA